MECVIIPITKTVVYCLTIGIAISLHQIWLQRTVILYFLCLASWLSPARWWRDRTFWTKWSNHYLTNIFKRLTNTMNRWVKRIRHLITEEWTAPMDSFRPMDIQARKFCWTLAPSKLCSSRITHAHTRPSKPTHQHDTHSQIHKYFIKIIIPGVLPTNCINKIFPTYKFKYINHPVNANILILLYTGDWKGLLCTT